MDLRSFGGLMASLVRLVFLPAATGSSRSCRGRSMVSFRTLAFAILGMEVFLAMALVLWAFVTWVHSRRVRDESRWPAPQTHAGSQANWAPMGAGSLRKWAR